MVQESYISFVGCCYLEYFLYLQNIFQKARLYRFKDFKDSLIKDLINIPQNITAIELFDLKKKKPKQSTVRSDRGEHYEETIPLPPDYKRKKYFKNCVQCYKSKIRKQTQFQCKMCRVALCPPCFEKYHVQSP